MRPGFLRRSSSPESGSLSPRASPYTQLAHAQRFGYYQDCIPADALSVTETVALRVRGAVTDPASKACGEPVRKHAACKLRERKGRLHVLISFSQCTQE